MFFFQQNCSLFFFLFLALALSLFSTLIKRKTWLCCCFFLSYGWSVLSRKFFVHMHVNFMCVNKVETMYRRLRIYVKVESHSIFTFTHCLSYIVSISFTHLNFTKNYTAVEINPYSLGGHASYHWNTQGAWNATFHPSLHEGVEVRMYVLHTDDFVRTKISWMHR